MPAKVGRSISFVLIALPEQFLHALAVLYTDSRHLDIMLSICVRLNADKVKIDSKSMGSISEPKMVHLLPLLPRARVASRTLC